MERELTDDVAPLGDLANHKGELTEIRLVIAFVPSLGQTPPTTFHELAHIV